MPAAVSIPSGVAQTWGTPGGLPAGQPTSGNFHVLTGLPAFVDTGQPLTLPAVPGPAIGEHWDLTRIFTPVSVVAANASAGPQPTVANVQISILTAGVLAWSAPLQVPLTANPNLVNTAGFSTIDTDFTNPIRLYPSQQAQLRYKIAFDEAVTLWDVMLAVELADVTNMQGQNAPGVVYYEPSQDPQPWTITTYAA